MSFLAPPRMVRAYFAGTTMSRENWSVSQIGLDQSVTTATLELT